MNEKCKYCDYVYKNDTEREEHSCKFSDREKQSRNVDGLMVWRLYKFWKSLTKQRPPRFEAFVESRYYTIFSNLLKHVQKNNIPDPEHYIRFCSSIGLMPTNWCMDDVYIEYLIYFDKNMPAAEQFKISVNTIATLANIIDCKPNEVLSYLNFDEILKFIHSRSLSPWYLLFSKAFDFIYNKKLTRGEKIVCDSIIDRNKWLEKLRKERETTKSILQLVKTHNI